MLFLGCAIQYFSNYYQWPFKLFISFFSRNNFKYIALLFFKDAQCSLAIVWFFKILFPLLGNLKGSKWGRWYRVEVRSVRSSHSSWCKCTYNYQACKFWSPGQMSVRAIHSLLYIIFKDPDWGTVPNNGPKFELMYQPDLNCGLLTNLLMKLTLYQRATVRRSWLGVVSMFKIFLQFETFVGLCVLFAVCSDLCLNKS